MHTEDGFQTPDILEALRLIHAGRLSGILSFPSAGEIVSLFFNQAQLQAIDPASMQRNLVPFLITRGVDVGALERNALGDISAGALRSVLPTVVEYMSGLLTALVCPTVGVLIHFQQGDFPTEGEGITSIPGLVLPLLTRHMGDDAVRLLAPKLEVRLRVAPDMINRTRGLALTPEQGFVLARLTDGIPVHDLVSSCGIPELTVLRALNAFFFFDLVGVAGGEQPHTGSAVPYAGIGSRPIGGTGPLTDTLPLPPLFPEDLHQEETSPTTGRVDDTSRLFETRPLYEPPLTNFRQSETRPQTRTLSTGSTGTLPVPPPQRQAPPAPSEALLDKLEELAYQIEKKDWYGLFGLPSSADPVSLRDHFTQLVKDYHPDKFHVYEDAFLLKRVETIYTQIHEAYEILRDDTRRSAYESEQEQGKGQPKPSSAQQEQAPAPLPYEDPKIKAQQHFAHGKEALRTKRYHDATEHLRESVRLMPEVSEYQFLLGKALSFNPMRLKEAEERLKEALRLVPNRVDYLLEMARFYQKVNLHIRAQGLYQKVLQFAPDNEEARVGAGLAPAPSDKTESKTESGLKGLFRKDLKDLFRKGGS